MTDTTRTPPPMPPPEVRILAYVSVRADHLAVLSDAAVAVAQLIKIVSDGTAAVGELVADVMTESGLVEQTETGDIVDITDELAEAIHMSRAAIAPFLPAMAPPDDGPEPVATAA